MTTYKASAAKRGRNPKFPYIAVVIMANGRTHNTNSGKAWATREEALTEARAWITFAVAHHAKQSAAYAARHAGA